MLALLSVLAIIISKFSGGGKAVFLNPGLQVAKMPVLYPLAGSLVWGG